jgi:hypothetical protein
MSMVTMDAGKAVAAMAEAALLPGSDQQSLYVRVEVRIHVSAYVFWNDEIRPRNDAEKEANEEMGHWKGDTDEAPWPDDLVASRSVHFLFRRPASNRQVFACQDDSWNLPKPEAFTFLSEHDSCWRDAVNEPLDAAVRHCSEQLEAMGVPRAQHDPPCTLWAHVARVTSTIMRYSGVDYGPGRYSVLSIGPVAQGD